MQFTLTSFLLRRLGGDQVLIVTAKAYRPNPAGTHIRDIIKCFFLFKDFWVQKRNTYFSGAAFDLKNDTLSPLKKAVCTFFENGLNSISK